MGLCVGLMDRLTTLDLIVLNSMLARYNRRKERERERLITGYKDIKRVKRPRECRPSLFLVVK